MLSLLKIFYSGLNLKNTSFFAQRIFSSNNVLAANSWSHEILQCGAYLGGFLSISLGKDMELLARSVI